MLDWLIAVGALCGAVAAIGVIVIAVDVAELIRMATASDRLPRAWLYRAKSVVRSRR